MKLFETKESMTRVLNDWDSKTFADAMAEFKVSDEDQDVIPLLIEVIRYQKLGDKKMNGFCSEDLKKDEFERMGVCYVDFFNKLENSDHYWTPLHILFEVCKNNLARRDFYELKAKKYKMTFERVTALMCGRALRALPSFIREYQLKNALQNAFPNATFYQDEELDRKFHCDIKMTLNDRDYYFWSFLSSARSIYQFVDKFRGNRYGEIMSGSHVLCPFDRKEESGASYRGWALYSSKYINEIRTAIFQKAHLDYNGIDVGAKFLMKTFRRPVVVDKSDAVCAA